MVLQIFCMKIKHDIFPLYKPLIFCVKINKQIEFVWLKWKLQKYIDLYVTYTLILSSQGGVSDVIKWNY